MTGSDVCYYSPQGVVSDSKLSSVTQKTALKEKCGSRDAKRGPNKLMAFSVVHFCIPTSL